MTSTVSTARQIAIAAIFAMVASIQFSIAIGQIALTIACAAYMFVLVAERRAPSLPQFASPLLLYAAWTLASASASLNPLISLADTKQLTLLLIVPVVFEFITSRLALTLTSVILTAGALSAVMGIGQYSLLEYDELGLRPRSTLSIYMTFAGLMMLVTNVAVARLLFSRHNRVWPAVTLPPVVTALVLSLTRSAWIGAAAGVSFQLSRRNYRWLGLIPVVVVLALAVAPIQLTNRAYSIFDTQDETRRDRVAMFQMGVEMIGDRPVFGVGPDMVRHVYASYRPITAIQAENPHLHNVPLQIAAERGLPALVIWLWFIAALLVGLFETLRHDRQRMLASAAIGAVFSMITAGMFEYNFGDSEFLMLFLVIVTLPFAADRDGGLP
jgi:putative inorganic carbon (HCO3(-)) transporter